MTPWMMRISEYFGELVNDQSDIFLTTSLIEILPGAPLEITDPVWQTHSLEPATAHEMPSLGSGWIHLLKAFSLSPITDASHDSALSLRFGEELAIAYLEFMRLGTSIRRDQSKKDQGTLKEFVEKFLPRLSLFFKSYQSTLEAHVRSNTKSDKSQFWKPLKALMVALAIYDELLDYSILSEKEILLTSEFMKLEDDPHEELKITRNICKPKREVPKAFNDDRIIATLKTILTEEKQRVSHIDDIDDDFVKFIGILSKLMLTELP
jgi:hypothetical protein